MPSLVKFYTLILNKISDLDRIRIFMQHQQLIAAAEIKILKKLQPLAAVRDCLVPTECFCDVGYSLVWVWCGYVNCIRFFII